MMVPLFKKYELWMLLLNFVLIEARLVLLLFNESSNELFSMYISLMIVCTIFPAYSIQNYFSEKAIETKNNEFL